MSLRIESHPVGEISANCHMLFEDSTGELVIVDPGGEADRVLERVEAHAPSRTTIWLTHGHIDHIGAAAEVARVTSAPVWVHRGDLAMLRDCVASGAHWLGLPFEPVTATDFFEEGTPLQALGRTWRALLCPGHSPGSVVLHCAELDLAIGGDVLFRGSIGRTDLPGGDPRAMSDSIRRLYRELPADTRFLTGHGPDTTLATERTSNPYVRLIMGTAAGA